MQTVSNESINILQKEVEKGMSSIIKENKKFAAKLLQTKPWNKYGNATLDNNLLNTIGQNDDQLGGGTIDYNTRDSSSLIKPISVNYFS